jgi:hypothetical protein
MTRIAQPARPAGSSRIMAEDRSALLGNRTARPSSSYRARTALDCGRPIAASAAPAWPASCDSAGSGPPRRVVAVREVPARPRDSLGGSAAQNPGSRTGQQDAGVESRDDWRRCRPPSRPVGRVSVRQVRLEATGSAAGVWRASPWATRRTRRARPPIDGGFGRRSRPAQEVRRRPGGVLRGPTIVRGAGAQGRQPGTMAWIAHDEPILNQIALPPRVRSGGAAPTKCQPGSTRRFRAGASPGTGCRRTGRGRRWVRTRVRQGFSDQAERETPPPTRHPNHHASRCTGDPLPPAASAYHPHGTGDDRPAHDRPG